MPDLRVDARAERVQKRTANQDSKRRQGATVAPQPESERSVGDAERCPPPKKETLHASDINAYGVFYCP